MTERTHRPPASALREVCLLIGRGDSILWSDASASPVWLPDSRERWDAIWRHRAELVEIAHSHPVGPLAFSGEDETTMAALAAALGRSPQFSVVAPGGMVRRCYPPRAADGTAPPPHQPPATLPSSASSPAPPLPVETILLPAAEPWWAGLLRLASGMQAEPAPLPSDDDLPAPPVPPTELNSGEE